LVLTATFPKVTQNVRYFALQRAHAGFFSLGRAFLQETHLTAVFDDPYGAYFNLSQAQYSPNTSAQIVEIVSRKRIEKRLTAGEIVLIVLGLAALCVIVFLAWAKAAKRAPFAKKKNRSNDDIEFGSLVNLRKNVAHGIPSANRKEDDDGASTKGSIYYEALSEIKNGEGSKEIRHFEESGTWPEPEKKKQLL